MALTAYVEVEGEKQGKFEGGVTQKGREKMIEVTQLEHAVMSPRDVATGQATGKRQHKPFMIWKPIDKASPLLLNALVQNENLKTVIFHFWAPDPKTATEKEFYTVTLTNAFVSGLETILPDVNVKSSLRPFERVAFTYQKVEWVIKDGNVTAMDDWESPVV